MSVEQGDHIRMKKSNKKVVKHYVLKNGIVTKMFLV